MSQSWQDILYNGLAAETGRTPPVYAGMITKANTDKQLSEIMAPQLNVVADNNMMRGINHVHKSKFSSHRAMSFLPQE